MSPAAKIESWAIITVNQDEVAGNLLPSDGKYPGKELNLILTCITKTPQLSGVT
jgi:hypothetical protein